ncbi:type II and III secretion system protein family protein [Aliiroseovarius crassostreae]|uniref:type II and III secretion system protein family protein n=1 Tax=Aliiroseovarius crassostreae TaxID=154981 RepID=UPI0022050D3E|nr:type II and III secretion system protein family protein [Aliiroseovarius crassostreae]UWP87847.1 type II and III secretion system protein family protein [Aliiroseovarius crassostreae]UWP91000.1 type II and III secretion system protein family protein [Aliiroseovarius crassostreae]UWQ00467.1 type II and III secretion system protein family protein [Aliiroseovarius crassostreae]
MSRILRNLVAAGLVGVSTLMIAAPTVAQETMREITLGDGVVDKFIIAPGHVVTVTTDKPVADLVVGNPAVADVFPLSDTSVYIQAKGSGFTNIAMYDDNKQLLGVMNVRVRRDFTELQNVIDRSVPGATVSVSNVNNRIRLTGDVRDNVALERVLQLASQYSEEPVINGIRVRSGQQVELDVRILEVQRNAGRQLGVNLAATRSDGLNVFNSGQQVLGQGAASAVATQGTPFGTIVGNILTGAGTQIDVVIDALEARGLARRLANPKLTTTSGVQANFVVGGEVPITRAVTGENGNTAEETAYREYGVRLNFRPVVLDDGLIQLRIRPEVSDIDETPRNGIGFISRKADTTVSLRDGQSFAIAGLLDVSNTRGVEQFPWLGQIPILGALFRSTEFQKRETDLVILVTPRLVRPAAPNEPLATPFDTSRSSNDVELFLLGMLEVDKRMIRSFREGDGVVGPYGHMVDLEFEDGLLVK